MKKISILGCGWLGLPLGKHLAERGYEVKGATTRAEKLPKLELKGIQPFQIKVGEQVEGEDLDHFFDTDCLIVTIPPRSGMNGNVSDYPAKIRAVDQLCQDKGIEKGIFTSTTGVYPDLNRVLREDTPPAPERDSAKAVWEAEQLLSGSSVDWTILRLAGLLGGTRKGGNFFAGKRNIPNGLAPVNLVHRKDVVGLILRLLEHEAPEKLSRLFNVVNDEHPSRAEFYTDRARQQNMELPHFIEELTTFKVISNERLKAELGYEFTYPNPMDFPV